MVHYPRCNGGSNTSADPRGDDSHFQRLVQEHKEGMKQVLHEAKAKQDPDSEEEYKRDGSLVGCTEDRNQEDEFQDAVPKALV